MRLGIVLAVVTVMVATACSTSTSEPESDSYNLIIEDALNRAIADGASQTQIDVLTESTTSGEVTFAQLNRVHEELLQCYADQGFTFTAPTAVEVAPGAQIYEFDYLLYPPQQLSEVQEDNLLSACHNQNWDHVASAYYASPIAMYWHDLPLENPKVIECLRSRGYEVEDDAPGSEINLLVSEDWHAHADVPGFVPCHVGNI